MIYDSTSSSDRLQHETRHDTRELQPRGEKSRVRAPRQHQLTFDELLERRRVLGEQALQVRVNDARDDCETPHDLDAQPRPVERHVEHDHEAGEDRLRLREVHYKRASQQA